MNISHKDYLGLAALLVAVLLAFSLLSPRFLSVANFSSMASQLPELGLLTLAMFFPIVSGGLNLAITFTANVCGLVAASVLLQLGGAEASGGAFFVGILLGLLVAVAIGTVVGFVIAYLRAHPILVTLASMIFLRGIGEFFTRGEDVSGLPSFVQNLGNGTMLGLPIPLWIFLLVVIFCYLLLEQSRLGLAIRLLGSNEQALRYCGVPTRRILCLTYMISSFIAALAGTVMLARFNSVRVGHGESYVLITVLACFLAGVDPFGGFGRVGKVLLSLLILQVLSSGLNLMGVNQHLATAVWGFALVLVMVNRRLWSWLQTKIQRTSRRLYA